MTAAIRFLLVLTLATALAMSAGCSSKQTGELPHGATGAKSDEHQVTETAQEQESAEMAAQQEAEQEKYRQEQLEEEARIAEMEAKAAAEQAAKAEQEAALQVLTEMVHFDFDSYELKAEARESLQTKAQILKQLPMIKMVVQGYCDNRGTEEYNLALGERRARAAFEFLVLLGVSPDRLSIVSYGEEDPIDPRSNEVAWAKNRRCEFSLIQ